MKYRVQIKTSWRWAPHKVGGRMFTFDNPHIAQKVADRLARETGHATRVVEVTE